MEMERIPTDSEIDAVLHAIDAITPYLNEREGTINASGWRDVYGSLRSLSKYELWLGLCNMEMAIFSSNEPISNGQATLYELFYIAYNEDMQALE
jgi:hypothetical protein